MFGIKGTRSRLAALMLGTTAFVTVAAPVKPAIAQSAQSYSIPAGGLAAALNRFADTAQIQLVYDASITRGLRSPGLNGSFTPQQAIGQLLSGTGLGWQFANANTVTITAPAGAAASAEPVPLPEGTVQLEEITVSGEKLERDLNKVFTSVGVVTNEQASDLVIPDMNGGLNQLANVRVSEARSGNSGIVVRGVSSDGLTQPTNSAPAVAMIVDGASQNGEGLRRGNRSTWDVETLEVLRGPQSALQGRNAMGGAVVLETYDPSWTWTGAVRGDLSGATEYDDGYARNGAFMLSGPLVEDQVAFRITGEKIQGEKGIEYADPLNEAIDDDDFWQVRGKLLITPEALQGFRALLSVSHTEDKPGQASVTGPDFFAREYDNAASNVEIRETHVTNYVADLSQDFGNGITLRSVTAFIETDATINAPDGSTFIRDELRGGEDITQDVRLEFEEGARPLSGVVGVQYGNFDNTTDSTIIVDFGGPLLFQDIQTFNKTEAIAGYADLRYEFVEDWSVLFGGRIGHETVRNERAGIVLNTNTFNYDSIDSESETDYLVALPKIGLAYNITEDQTVAFTYSEGFRAGFTSVDGAGDVYSVEPEYLTSYELAYRARGFDDRVEFRTNAFYYEFTDLQIDIDDPVLGDPFTVTRNIGEAYAYGAEFEVRYRVNDPLTVFAGLGLLKTKIDEADVGGVDYSGNEFPEAPFATVNLGAVYKHDSGFFASADIAYTTSYFSTGDLANNDNEEVPEFGIVNAAVGYDFNAYMSMTLYAKNIFDEEYVTGISINDSDPTDMNATIGDGRYIGIRAEGRF
ncbi:TonB-dependent receptor [Terrihabitans soli]|uniref:TonB-dependent receptor n=1 Tax=Terrihabitans soli TaxID=708113 RepID=A0A6S6QJT3_9HYPH|nr:TonB-dependent receptor [Terrihabitans soli]BCJ90574.1 TonB-dependent receptor [Terrihabitans soli]